LLLERDEMKYVIITFLCLFGCDRVDDIEFETDGAHIETNTDAAAYAYDTAFDTEYARAVDSDSYREAVVPYEAVDTDSHCMEWEGEALVTWEDGQTLTICCQARLDFDGNIEIYDYDGNAIEVNLATGEAYLNVVGYQIPVRYRHDDFGVVEWEDNQFKGTLEGGVVVSGCWGEL